MLESKFSSFPAISLIARFGGGGWWEKLKLKLTQPQVELEAWAELGKKHRYSTRKPPGPKVSPFGFQEG